MGVTLPHRQDWTIVLYELDAMSPIHWGGAPPVRPDHARALVATSLAALLRKSISVDEWGMMVSIIVSTAEKTATVMKGVLEEKQDAINNMQKREAGLNFWPLPKCFFY